MKRAFAVAAVALLVLVAGGAAADSFALTVVTQTNSTITFSYPQQPGYGYLYSANGAVVSRTNDPSRTSVKFSKNPQNSYEVASVAKGTTGSYSPTPPPPPPPVPVAPSNVRVVTSTQTSITVGWDPVADATNYHIYRGTTLLGQGPGSNGGYADVWQDGGLTCDTTYTYSVDAVTPAGTSAKVPVSGSTASCSTPPPPPPPSTITPSQFQTMAVNGATIQNVTVTGSVTITNDNVTVTGSVIQGTINLASSASGTTISNSTAVDFDADGADNTTITGNTFDAGPGKSCQSFIWPGVNRDPSNGWTITGNTFRNYQCTEPHSEALYIAAYAQHGLIEGNTFVNNGNTSHVFFTWCDVHNDCTSWGGGYKDPHDWSVRNNTFYDTWTAYFAINGRDEMAGNPNLNICVDNHQTVTGPVIPPASGNGGLAQFMYPPTEFMLQNSCPDPR